MISTGFGEAIITDYNMTGDGIDSIGLMEGITESDLTLNYVEGHTRIEYGNDLMAIVQNTISEDINFI